MKIAIIGAGFAGLATAWTILQRNQNKKSVEVTIFEAKAIGGGASGVAAGLMHPFANVHSKLNRWGFESYAASMKLLNAAEAALGKRPYEGSGILRPALRPLQKDEYYLAAQKYPDDIRWIEADEVSNWLPGVIKNPAIFIKKGLTVFPDEYLQGLWLACQSQGAIFSQQSIHSLEELKHFDQIILTLGASSHSIKELADLPLRYTKGQILELLWPEGLAPLPMALNANIYCVMLPDLKRCLVGSTYEKQFASPQADLATAKGLIFPKLLEIYPPLKDAKILDCRAGVRVSTPQHLPWIKQINERCYLYTGLGSKGLLYHALYAERLCDLMGF